MVLLAGALAAAALLMLLSACVNTGSLLLSRGIARRAELTIKVALGADRSRLMRQILIESVLLAGAVFVNDALAQRSVRINPIAVLRDRRRR